MSDFLTDEQMQQAVAAQPPSVAPAAAQPDFIPDGQFTPDEERYGSFGQQALAGAEGLAKGVAGPLATGAEALLHKAGVPGLSPEEQAGRAASSPVHDVAEGVGLVGPAVASLGLSAAARAGLELPEALTAGANLAHTYSQSGVLSGATEAVSSALGINRGTNLVGRIGASAFKGALETALYQAGDETSKRINDPELGTSDMIAHIGLSGLIGAVGGGALGAISPLWTKANEAPVAQAIQDFNNTVDGSVIDHAAEAPVNRIEETGFSGLRNQKENVKELTDIAARNNWPLPEGITSGSREIQQAEDTLLKGPPTVAAVGRRKIYQGAYDAVNQSVDQAISADANAMSETEAGNALKQSLTTKLEAENEPIKQLYGALEHSQQAIQLTDRSTGSLSRNIEKLIEEKGLVPGSERYNYLKTFAQGIENVDNLQKLKNFRTEVSRSAGPLSKDLAAAINEKLDGVEERAIRRYAETMRTPQAKQVVMDLIDQVGEAKSSYAKFRDKLETLGSAIGKRKIYGPQDFIDFVNEINPQHLARRLFNDSNTEFASYFSKAFPEEMGIMRGYQRGLVRQAAMKDGAFSANKAIKEVLGFQPEMQKLIATPEEIKTLKDAKTYLEAMPKSFNPSGTAHESAFRAFFEHPTGAAIANLRDFGIQGFIKAFGRAVPGAEREASNVIPLLGNAVGSKEVNPGAFKHAVDYATSAIQGARAIDRAARSAFVAAIPIAAIAYPDQKKIESLDKKVKAFQSDPSLHDEVGGSLGHYLPSHDIAIKGQAASVVAYLNSIRPKPVRTSPLDPEIKPSGAAMAEYHRALMLAESPLSAITLLKDGKLTTQDVGHLRAMYPGLLSQLASRLTDHLVHHLSKDRPVPYGTRQGLSALIGQPLDSSLTPQSVQMNQVAFSQSQQGQPSAQMARPSKSGMQKMNPGNRLSLDHSRDGE